MICLVDVNSFYASCEVSFQPKLESKPVVVLSNNDGCVIARSLAAKNIGIKMGIPYFEIKDLCNKHNVAIFSSNYTLYADISSRFMQILSEFGVQQEVYSIDESFLDLTGIADLTIHGQNIKKRVKQWLGLPVCVGIGHTKVLAKFANYLAKKHSFLNGVCNLEELGSARTDKAMQLTDVSEVWGIGRKIANKLKLMGINTVYDLKVSDSKHLRNIFNITMEKIIAELNQVQCIELEDFHEPKRRINSSRLFGQPVNDRNSLMASYTYHIEKISRKLRTEGLYARQMVIYASTNRFNDNYLSKSVNVMFPAALDSYRYLIKYLNEALDAIYKPGVLYKKSGILVHDLITDEFESKDLFDVINIKKDDLLPMLEQIRKQYGRNSITLASSKLSDKWIMKSNFISNEYTTNVNELLTIS